MEENITTALAKLSTQVDGLAKQVDVLARQVSDHESKLRWVTSAALLVIGVIGGPNAVELIAAGAAQ